MLFFSPVSAIHFFNPPPFSRTSPEVEALPRNIFLQFLPPAPPLTYFAFSHCLFLKRVLCRNSPPFGHLLFLRGLLPYRHPPWTFLSSSCSPRSGNFTAVAPPPRRIMESFLLSFTFFSTAVSSLPKRCHRFLAWNPVFRFCFVHLSPLLLRLNPRCVVGFFYGPTR